AAAVCRRGRFDSCSARDESLKRLEFTRSPDEGRHGVQSAPAIHNLKLALPGLLQERVFLVSDKPVQRLPVLPRLVEPYLSVDAIGLKVPTFQRYFSHVSEASSVPAWDKTALNHPVVPDHIVVNQKFVEFLRRLKLHQLKSGVVGFRELVRVNVREPAHWALATVVDARNGRFIIVAPLVLLRLAL